MILISLLNLFNLSLHLFSRFLRLLQSLPFVAFIVTKFHDADENQMKHDDDTYSFTIQQKHSLIWRNPCYRCGLFGCAGCIDLHTFWMVTINMMPHVWKVKYSMHVCHSLVDLKWPVWRELISCFLFNLPLFQAAVEFMSLSGSIR